MIHRGGRIYIWKKQKYIYIFVYVCICICIYMYTGGIRDSVQCDNEGLQYHLFLLVCVCDCICIHTHTRTHTHTHAHTRAHTHSQTHTQRDKNTHTLSLHTYTHAQPHTHTPHTHTRTHTHTLGDSAQCMKGSSTGCRRLIGSPKLQIIFHKRATKYRSLLRKMTYKDKGSYESSPPSTTYSFWYVSATVSVCV